MQLKLKRSQREGGLISKSVIFCLDARADFTPEERNSISRYKLHNEVIYNSEAQLRLLEKSAVQRDGSFVGSLKSLATVALAHTQLYITIASLQKGQHVECKSLEELIGAEEAICIACQNLKAYLEAALTFDGREVLVDFATGVPQIVAEAVTPQAMLAAPAPHPAPAPPVAYAPAEQALPVDEASVDTGAYEPNSWEKAVDRKIDDLVQALRRVSAERWASIVAIMLVLVFVLKAFT